VIELLTDPQTWITLVTLSAIEIVLGIDNLVFISIAVSKLPLVQREKARKFGIAVACITRVALLLTLAWLAGLTHDLFSVFGMGISVRDLVLILGGVFLLVKGTMEIRDFIERNPTIKMLALAFIVLVGVYLIADGLGLHIPKGYIYGAMGFSAAVECLNLWARRNERQRLSAD